MLKKGKVKIFFVMGWFVITMLSLVLVLPGCRPEKPYEIYQKFENHTWPRFDQKNFNIPVQKAGMDYDVVLFAYFTSDFQFDALEVSVIMNTPSGEERINSYKMDVRNKAGTLIIPCVKDSCKGEIVLKKGLYMAKTGNLTIVLENLIPRLQADGILGLGIRLVPTRK